MYIMCMYVYRVFMCVHVRFWASQCGSVEVWRPEDNFVESVPLPGIELKFSSLVANALYLRSHPAGPLKTF